MWFCVSVRVFLVSLVFELVDQGQQVALPMQVGLIQSSEGLSRTIGRGRVNSCPLPNFSSWGFSVLLTLDAGFPIR